MDYSTPPVVKFAATLREMALAIGYGVSFNAPDAWDGFHIAWAEKDGSVQQLRLVGN